MKEHDTLRVVNREATDNRARRTCMKHRLLLIAGLALTGTLLLPLTPATAPEPAVAGPSVVQAEQRGEITIRNYDFLLSQPVPIRLHVPTVIILRNQDIVRHGFTSPMFAQMLVRGEGEGISAYGKGIEGFHVDPGKTLVIRFTPERPGKYSFRCDLHPDMKGELYLLELPAA